MRSCTVKGDKLTVRILLMHDAHLLDIEVIGQEDNGIMTELKRRKRYVGVGHVGESMEILKHLIENRWTCLWARKMMSMSCLVVCLTSRFNWLRLFFSFKLESTLGGGDTVEKRKKEKGKREIKG